MDSWFAYVYIKCEWMKVCVCMNSLYELTVATRAPFLFSHTYGVAHHFVNVGTRRIHAKCWKMNSLARSFSSFALAPSCDGHGCKCTHTDTQTHIHAHINLKSYSRCETTWFDHINFPRKKFVVFGLCEKESQSAVLHFSSSVLFRCFVFFSTLSFARFVVVFFSCFHHFGRNG